MLYVSILEAELRVFDQFSRAREMYSFCLFSHLVEKQKTTHTHMLTVLKELQRVK